MLNESRTTTTDEVMASLWQAKRLMHGYILRSCSDSDLSPSQMHLLMSLGRDKSSTVKALARDMCLTPGAITQLVEPLVQRQLLERSPDQHDRRVWHLRLTDASKSQVRQWQAQRSAAFKTILEALTDTELNDYLAIQTKLIAHLEHLSTTKGTN